MSAGSANAGSWLKKNTREHDMIHYSLELALSPTDRRPTVVNIWKTSPPLPGDDFYRREQHKLTLPCYKDFTGVPKEEMYSE